jgi:hypothetical protein
MTVRSDTVTGQFLVLLVAPSGASVKDCSPRLAVLLTRKRFECG